MTDREQAQPLRETLRPGERIHDGEAVARDQASGTEGQRPDAKYILRRRCQDMRRAAQTHAKRADDLRHEAALLEELLEALPERLNDHADQGLYCLLAQDTRAIG